MSQHTPGPWTCNCAVYGDGEWAINTPLRRLAVVNNATGNAKANARLIAKAPEMLEILQKLATFENYAFNECEALIWKDARALLREIEGESQ